MSKASLEQWLERIEALHPNEMDLGVERVATVARHLDLLPVSVPVISLAGTNGKGSASAVLEAVLVEVGCVVGVCSSPHFLRFNERIRVGGCEVSDDLIVEAFELIDSARGEISLTYFEFGTLAALLVFSKLDVNFMVLEVGLGGRLDAVNIVDASVAIITSIELDHQQWLGDSRDLIAVEKAGILRSGQAAVIGEPDPPASLCRVVRELEVEALYYGQDFFIREDAGKWTGTLQTSDGGTRQLIEMKSAALLPVNICTALQALLLACVDFSDQQLSRALDNLHLPGRRESIEVAGRSYLMDVAHNPAAINKLLEHIDVTPCNGRTIALFSAMADKDLRNMIQPCASHFDGWFLAEQPNNDRAAKATSLADILRSEGTHMISISKNIKQAFRRAQSLMNEGDRLVVFGSFFTVAAVMPLLDKDRAKVTQ
jgi:dihydrofolate synthase/folylpolyglutamate synthase